MHINQNKLVSLVRVLSSKLIAIKKNDNPSAKDVFEFATALGEVRMLKAREDNEGKAIGNIAGIATCEEALAYYALNTTVNPFEFWQSNSNRTIYSKISPYKFDNFGQVNAKYKNKVVLSKLIEEVESSVINMRNR